jgi:superfamily II DNA or RNA helicase
MALTRSVIATWQTLASKNQRIKKFKPKQWDVIMVDEAHHAGAPQ